MTNVLAADVYNPKRILALAESADYFRSQVPFAVKQLLKAAPADLGGQQANAAVGDMYNEARKFANEYSHTLLMFLYFRWARENGITKVVDDFDHPKLMNELSAEETQKWNDYLLTVEIPREIVVEALKANKPLPVHPIHTDSGPVRYIAQTLFQARTQFVLSLLPDITDPEAERLFGQLMTAEELHRLAAEDLLT